MNKDVGSRYAILGKDMLFQIKASNVTNENDNLMMNYLFLIDLMH